jgi:hypothetical protein
LELIEKRLARRRPLLIASTMVYTYRNSSFVRWIAAKPFLLHPIGWMAGAGMIWYSFTIKKLADERKFYIYAHPKWAPRKFHTSYNWQRDPIKGTFEEQFAALIRKRGINIEDICNVKLPVNSY